MEEPTNQLVEKTQEAHNEVPNSSLALLRDNLEFFGVRANFYNETVIIKEIVHKIELKDKDLPKKEQELLDNFEEKAEVKKNLVNILEEPKSQQKVETNQKNDETFIRTNGFYYCPECKYKTRWSMDNLKIHINAVHRQLKPFECSDCAKSKQLRLIILNNFIDVFFSFQLFQEKLIYHNID